MIRKCSSSALNNFTHSSFRSTTGRVFLSGPRLVFYQADNTQNSRLYSGENGNTIHSDSASSDKVSTIESFLVRFSLFRMPKPLESNPASAVGSESGGSRSPSSCLALECCWPSTSLPGWYWELGNPRLLTTITDDVITSSQINWNYH